MIARLPDQHLLLACRLFRYGFLAVEVAEGTDPSLTPYVQEAVGRVYASAGLMRASAGPVLGVFMTHAEFEQAARAAAR